MRQSSGSGRAAVLWCSVLGMLACWARARYMPGRCVAGTLQGQLSMRSRGQMPGQSCCDQVVLRLHPLPRPQIICTQLRMTLWPEAVSPRMLLPCTSCTTISQLPHAAWTLVATLAVPGMLAMPTVCATCCALCHVLRDVLQPAAGAAQEGWRGRRGREEHALGMLCAAVAKPPTPAAAPALVHMQSLRDEQRAARVLRGTVVMLRWRCVCRAQQHRSLLDPAQPAAPQGEGGKPRSAGDVIVDLARRTCIKKSQ